MRLAVLGTDDDVLALIQAANSRGHQVVWVSDARPSDAAAIAILAPAIHVESAWEGVLDHDLADAVLVGAGTASDELRLEWLRRLVADAIPTLSTYPISTSVLPYFELDMVRQETDGVLRHYNRVLDLKALGQVSEWLRVGHPTIGRIRQLTWERQLRSAAPEDVFAAQARDAEVMLAVVERITRVSAVGPRQESGDYAAMNVQLNTAGEITCTWTCSRGDSSSTKIVLVGEHGRLEVAIADQADGEHRWQIGGSGASSSAGPPLPVADPALAAIDELAAVVEPRASPPVDHSTWPSATRAMEVVDAVQLSLLKGRSVEILHQQLTEQLAFRGVMSAFGCGLLMVGMLVLIIAGIAGDALGFGRVGWPIGLVTLLTIFLLLQLVPLTRRR